MMSLFPEKHRAPIIVFTSTLISVLILTSVSLAAEIWTCDYRELNVGTYFDNETVYVTSNDITDGVSKEIRIYIVENNDSWVNGTSLVDVSGNYRTITTNSSGQIALAPLWDSPVPGVYDIVADINQTGDYHEGFDYVNSLTVVGFEIKESTNPRLILKIGPSSPGAHDWYMPNTSSNDMLQFNVTAGSAENVNLLSISILAKGSGDDRNDITAARLIRDGNLNGKYDSGEYMLGMNSFLIDNGALVFEISGGYIISANKSAMFIIAYDMKSGGVGDTYVFDIVSVSAKGTSTEKNAEIIGLPLGSSMTTLRAASMTTTTIPIPVDECETDGDCSGISCVNKIKTTYTCEFDSNKGVNICAPALTSVSCCVDSDCVTGYYCLNYKCVSQSQGSSLVSDIQSAVGGNMLWIIGSILIVVSVALIVFLNLKNKKRPSYKVADKFQEKTSGIMDKVPFRKKNLFPKKKDPWDRHPPWESSRNVERDWEELKRKWEKKKEGGG